MVVLGILAVIAAVALPFAGGSGLAGGRAAATARELVSALRSTRADALAANRMAVFTLDAEGRVFRAAGGAARPVASGVAVTAAGGRDRVTFYPDGGSSGGRFAIEPGGIVIDVDWMTGAVRRLS